jgi:hypothetical protein
VENGQCKAEWICFILFYFIHVRWHAFDQRVHLLTLESLSSSECTFSCAFSDFISFGYGIALSLLDALSLYTRT